MCIENQTRGCKRDQPRSLMNFYTKDIWGGADYFHQALKNI